MAVRCTFGFTVVIDWRRAAPLSRWRGDGGEVFSNPFQTEKEFRPKFARSHLLNF